MVPAIRNISIPWPNFVFQQTDREFGGLMSNITRELYHGLKIVLFLESGSTNLPTVINPLGFSSITHLTYKHNTGHTWAVEFVQRNATSLKAVVLFTSFDKRAALALLHENQGNAVVYSALQIFDVDMLGNRDRSGIQIPPNPEQSRSLVVHFPRIRSVFTHGIYPFKDDVLFRGHNGSSTLEKINIYTNVEFVKMAEEQRFFVLNRFPRLHYVVLSYNNPYNRVRDQEKVALNRCIRQIIEATNTSTTIRVFKSAGDLSANVLIHGISSLVMLASVQTIDIACCHLEFADIVTILRHAPFIRSLHCAAAICVPEIKGMHRDELT
ncbi:hypothetical protein LPJ66_008344 [Kickxella alabastrina]|uniref:Uncharacterized protein n=1 Tax=Kickxella alabastrina TaxID=61397 RepID=A0ACC1ICH2_9FUNG|nr:hypothetical protein LPJ66_008344 [Kickxella alabastrina]